MYSQRQVQCCLHLVVSALGRFDPSPIFYCIACDIQSKTGTVSPSLSAHNSVWTELPLYSISIYHLPRYSAMNCGLQSVVKYLGLTLQESSSKGDFIEGQWFLVTDSTLFIDLYEQYDRRSKETAAFTVILTFAVKGHKNSIYGEIKSRSKWGNACYHSVLLNLCLPVC